MKICFDRLRNQEDHYRVTIMNMIKESPQLKHEEIAWRAEREGRERKRQKKHRGNPAGNVSRKRKINSAKNTAPKDPRIGSKKPIPLIVGDAPKVVKKNLRQLKQSQFV